MESRASHWACRRPNGCVLCWLVTWEIAAAAAVEPYNHPPTIHPTSLALFLMNKIFVARQTIWNTLGDPNSIYDCSGMALGKTYYYIIKCIVKGLLGINLSGSRWQRVNTEHARIPGE